MVRLVKGGEIKYDLDADVGASLCQSAWIDASSWLVLEAFATFTAIKMSIVELKRMAMQPGS